MQHMIPSSLVVRAYLIVSFLQQNSHTLFCPCVVIVALNFTTLAASGPLPLDHIPENLSYVTKHIVPFAATLAGQVLSCPARDNTFSKSDGLFIRWLLNDGVVPQTGVAGCPNDPDGLCPLGTYIASLTQRSAEIDFAFDCNGNYTVPAPAEDMIVDGRPPVNERPDFSWA